MGPKSSKPSRNQGDSKGAQEINLVLCFSFGPLFIISPNVIKNTYICLVFKYTMLLGNRAFLEPIKKFCQNQTSHWQNIQAGIIT